MKNSKYENMGEGSGASNDFDGLSFNRYNNCTKSRRSGLPSGLHILALNNHQHRLSSAAAAAAAEC